jgi:diguanylate cyclase (GGDEF)-like protein/PAS domain S-box-containing protein
MNIFRQYKADLVAAGELINDLPSEHYSDLASRILTCSDDGIVICDAEPAAGSGVRVVYVNEAFSRDSGYTFDEIVGKSPKILQGPKTDLATLARIRKSLKAWQPIREEVLNYKKNGEEFWQSLNIFPVADSQGWFTHWVAIQHNVTRRRLAEAQVSHLAFYDQLTGLPNRRLALDRLQHALPTTTRKHECGALLYIDIDNFKVVNDSLGHNIGDELLRQLGARLTSCVRATDTVARLGGDEFLVLLEGLSDSIDASASQVVGVGEKIRECIAKPYHLKQHMIDCTVSIGATVFQGQGEDVEKLLKRADLALYQAKAQGRNALRFFDWDMQSAMDNRVAVERDLRTGLKKNWFSLFYQPQVDSTGCLVGVEALVRLQHPVRGLVLPADFISVAEETGLIISLGGWVMNTACEQLAQWATTPMMADLSIAVNVSARQFHQGDFVNSVRTALDRSGARASRLKIELTESVALVCLKDTVAKINALREDGVCFCLDDFGTGYSSLSYLRQLPFDQIKIDQSFVQDLPSNPDACSIVRTIIALGKTLNLGIVAEGVETQSQQDFLEEHSCTLYQGYLYGRPAPVEQLTNIKVGKSTAGRVLNGPAEPSQRAK